ncbi:MAG: hypothetical protein KAG66_18575 [Methylococcales bacterium]|nr:hypothetical protein [Methylococcales bacterium]
MKTKNYQRFINRIGNYESDLELSNVLITNFIAKTANSEGTLAEATGANPLTHLKLAGCINTKQSRKVLGLHLKKTLYSSFIKDLYEDFTDFLRATLESAARVDPQPERFIGNTKINMGIVDILKLGSWPAFLGKVSEDIFRSLENERSTITLVSKLNEKLGLQVHESAILAAMPYLDARHIFVHRDGKADKFYKDTHTDVALDAQGKIKLDFIFVNAARLAVCELANQIDQQIIATNLTAASDVVH